MMHIITKVAIAAAVPAAVAVGFGYLAMRAPRPEAAQLLYVHAFTVAVIGILVGVIVWAATSVQEALRHLADEKEEARVRLVMAAMRRGVDTNLIYGPKDL